MPLIFISSRAEINLTIRFRLNGILHPSLFLPLKVHLAIVARIKILSGLKIDENRVPQDGRFSAKINERMLILEFRHSRLFTEKKLRLGFWILPQD